MKKQKLSFIIFLMFGFSSLIFAEDSEKKEIPELKKIEHSTSINLDFAYYFPTKKGYEQEGGFLPVCYKPAVDPNDAENTVGSTWGGAELRVKLNHSIKVPFLQGKGGLTSGNNIKFNFTGNITPVAVYGTVAAVWTPIAFLNFELGANVGTGWDIVLFNGLGDNDPELGIDKTAFQGVVLEAFSSGTFQFDLGAVMPGDWTHIITQLNAKFTYKMFSSEKAMAGGAWQWLADSGENLNGWLYNGSYFLGYQMPTMVNLVGFLVATEQMIDKNSEKSILAGPDGNLSVTADNGWGSDFVEIAFGPVANLVFNDENSLFIELRFKNGIDYTDSTIFEKYYQNRKAEDIYIYFDRIAFSYTYKF